MSRTAAPGSDRISGPWLFFQAWLPSFLAFFASGLALFSLNWWITQEAGGAVLGVVVGVANIASVVTVVLLSGMIDRSDRRRFVLRIVTAFGCALGLLAGVYQFPYATLVLLVAAACYLLLECAYAIYMAAIETTVADLAPPSWASRRTASLIQLQPQVERTVAPFVGGWLLAAGLLEAVPLVALAWVGVTALCTWAARSAFAAAQPAVAQSGAAPGPATASASPDAEPADRPRWSPLALLGTTRQDVSAALQWIRRDPLLCYLVVVGVVVNLVLFPFYVLLPAYLAEYETLDGQQQALLYGRAGTAYGIGMLVSTGLLTGLAKRGARPAGYATLCVLLLCGLLGTLSLGPPVLVVPGMAVLGLVFIVLVAVAGGGWLERTPSEVRARVFSVRRLVVFSSIPLGTSLMGFGGAAMGYFPFLRVLLVLVVSTTIVSYALYVRAASRHERRPASEASASAPGSES